MVHKCVNPFCNQPFQDSHRGKLFVVDFPRNAMDHLTRRRATREHFWLCDECARDMTVAVRREYESVVVRIINLPESGATKLKFTPAEPGEMFSPFLQFQPEVELTAV
jgi:hypothetical protein